MGIETAGPSLHCSALTLPHSLLWTSSLCPPSPWQPPLSCLPIPLSFRLPFSSQPPFCSCLFVWLPVSLLSAQLLWQPFPLPVQGEVPGSTPLGVVPTSLSHLPQGLFLLLGEPVLQRFWPRVLCEEDSLSGARGLVLGDPCRQSQGRWRWPLGLSPQPHWSLPPLLARKEAAEAGDTSR